MNKAKVGILGTGNIGSDLLMKIIKSDELECSIFAGRNPQSSGIKKAVELGILSSSNGISALMDAKDNVDIIIDATSAKAHTDNEEILEKCMGGGGKYIINLTPTKTGQRCVPFINGMESIYYKEVNMITCAGQATIPLAYAIVNTGCDISYIETVSTISSKSAGTATRENIDEFIETTAEAMSFFTGIKHTKSIMIINPNEPPVDMRNTIYFRMTYGNMDKIQKAVRKTEIQMKKYVPGYKIIVAPTFMDNILSLTVEVSGNGDFLPKYAGNLDIITCAAIEMAKKYNEQILVRRENFEKTYDI